MRFELSRVGAIALLAVAATASSPVRAGATTITFDTLPAALTTVYVEQGYVTTFTGRNGLGYIIGSGNCSPTCADNGTLYATVVASFGWWADTISIRRQDGGAFTFGSFAGAENLWANNAGGVWATEITATGLRADLSTFVQSFTLDWVNDGAGGQADFQTLLSSSGSDRFIELSFTGVGGGRDFSIDDVNLQAVPEPTTLALLAGGLVALRARRRRTP